MISDYEEKKRIVAYFKRINKGSGISRDEVIRVWSQWWKEDLDGFGCDEIISDICKCIVEMQIPTRKLSKRQTLEYLRNEIFSYRVECYKNLLENAHKVNWDIQNQTSKKHRVCLGRYKIKGTGYVGTYDEISKIIMERAEKYIPKVDKKKVFVNMEKID